MFIVFLAIGQINAQILVL